MPKSVKKQIINHYTIKIQSYFKKISDFNKIRLSKNS